MVFDVMNIITYKGIFWLITHDLAKNSIFFVRAILTRISRAILTRSSGWFGLQISAGKIDPRQVFVWQKLPAYSILRA